MPGTLPAGTANLDAVRIIGQVAAYSCLIAVVLHSYDITLRGGDGDEAR